MKKNRKKNPKIIKFHAERRANTTRCGRAARVRVSRKEEKQLIAII